MFRLVSTQKVKLDDSDFYKLKNIPIGLQKNK